ncbi:hypothetical protein INS49_012194 [Diaporthe citri]|uniref:uncharacterized protein n=1 Tax=Diaporthe citri TaxID=83186 RepID=UPI001C7EB34C|nr:uncharacterized protein INS49_012194 [Diaporthe citri]KAG6358676.1 hypothetical protein INS49_012194 [Diaporthe citri]
MSDQQSGQQQWVSPAAKKYESGGPAREPDTGARGPAPRTDPNPQQGGQQPATGADAAFQKLPASLLLLVAAQVGQGLADAQRLPTAIRKMSPDAGEKLLHEYYAFGGEEEVAQVGTQAQPAMLAKGVLDVEEEELLAANSSASVSFRAPFAPHFDPHLAARGDEGGASGWHLFQRAKDVVARLEKRQRAERDCYGDRCDADEHSDFVGQRFSDNDHRHRHSDTLCELEFNLHEGILHDSHLNINDLNRDVLWSRGTRPPDLDEHLDHTPWLLSHGLLRLFSCLRRRLLPDRPRLPGDIMPIDTAVQELQAME